MNSLIKEIRCLKCVIIQQLSCLIDFLTIRIFLAHWVLRVQSTPCTLVTLPTFIILFMSVNFHTIKLIGAMKYMQALLFPKSISEIKIMNFKAHKTIHDCSNLTSDNVRRALSYLCNKLRGREIIMGCTMLSLYFEFLAELWSKKMLTVCCRNICIKNRLKQR